MYGEGVARVLIHLVYEEEHGHIHLLYTTVTDIAEAIEEKLKLHGLQDQVEVDFNAEYVCDIYTGITFLSGKASSRIFFCAIVIA